MRVGIVGHRYFRDGQVAKFIAAQVRSILEQIRDGDSNLVVLSAIAEGADTIFAEEALALGIPVEIVIPFHKYSSDFITESARIRYHNLRAAAQREETLPYHQRSNSAYESAMNWVVNHSDLLVAVWDGYPAKGLGGTGHAVARAIELRQSWIHLDVTHLTVTRHISQSWIGLPEKSQYAISA